MYWKEIILKKYEQLIHIMIGILQNKRNDIITLSLDYISN